MDKKSIEQFDTPLEQALADLPQEDAPEGLQDRCLAALDEAAKGTAPGKSGRWEAWRQFVAAAAVIVMLVGVGGVLFPPKVREKARQVMPRDVVVSTPATAMAPGAPRGGPAAGDVMAIDEVAPSRPVNRTKVAQERRYSPPRKSAAPAGGASNAGRPTQSASGGAPWRDEDEGRRKVTSRSMELEVREVEESYKQAVAIVEKAGGFVLNEELTVSDRRPDEARLTCKIPVAQFDGVLAQVRELGKIVLLTGNSQDMTLQYQQEGADIRGSAAEIEKLAAELTKATTEGQKKALRSRIEGLKRQLEEHKQEMRGLHNVTSYAQMSLTLKELRGLRYFVTNAAREALPLAMSLALIAVPLLVLMLVWKRKR